MNMWTLIRLARRWRRRRARNPYYDPRRGHHTPWGFRNNEAHSRAVEDAVRGPRPPGLAEIGPVHPRPDLLNGPGRSLTWIGHSTVLARIDGLNILTDPIFGARASPLRFAGPRRLHPPGLALAQLPPIDLVLVSHAHYDHADLASLRGLARGHEPRFVVPLGMERWLRRRLPASMGQRVVGLDWWQETDVAGATVALVPSHHWSARSPWDTDTMLWGSFVVERNGFRFFFSGDLAYSGDSLEVGRRYGPVDAAAIAIGHYEPRVVMRRHHICPDEAVRIHREIGARRSLGIHWGTFQGLTAEPLDQPLFDLAAARRRHGVGEEEFFTLRPGETRRV